MFQLSRPGRPLIAAAVIFWGVFSATAANANTIAIFAEEHAVSHAGVDTIDIRRNMENPRG